MMLNSLLWDLTGKTGNSDFLPPSALSQKVTLGLIFLPKDSSTLLTTQVCLPKPFSVFKPAETVKRFADDTPSPLY